MEEYTSCLEEGFGEDVEETIDSKVGSIFPLPPDLLISDVQ